MENWAIRFVCLICQLIKMQLQLIRAQNAVFSISEFVFYWPSGIKHSPVKLAGWVRFPIGSYQRHKKTWLVTSQALVGGCKDNVHAWNCLIATNATFTTKVAVWLPAKVAAWLLEQASGDKSRTPLVKLQREKQKRVGYDKAEAQFMLCWSYYCVKMNALCASFVYF